MNLIWTQPDQYHLRTTCNRFTISRAKQGEFIAYTAWRVRPKQPGEILGTTLAAANDSDERVRALDGMKALCERELETQGAA